MARPNILFIVADHHTWHAIANRSPAHTPHINRLMSEGLLFDRSYTPISVCCPTRAMLASGAYPWHNGVHHQVHVPQTTSPDMNPDVVTYAHRLSQAGYRTLYLGKWHASHTRGPLDLGWQIHGDICSSSPTAPYYDRHPIPEDEFFDLYKKQFPNRKISNPQEVRWPGSEPFLMWGCDESPAESTHTHFLSERASHHIRKLATERKSTGAPWHMEVHFPEPHDDYTPLRKFLEKYKLEDITLPESYYKETFINKPGLHSREASLWNALDETQFREGVRHFYAYCEQVDHYVGRILSALEESGEASETLVIFTSDHGDLMGAHRMFIKGWMPYEEAHRIPMVARWPGVIPPGSRSSALVQLHDWAHTFVSLAGAEALPYRDGKDLSPILKNPSAQGPDHILNIFAGAEYLYTQRILIGQRYKYVFNGFDWDEFYDLQTDPGELTNLIKVPGLEKEISQARKALYEICKKLGDPFEAQRRYGLERYLPRS